MQHLMARVDELRRGLALVAAYAVLAGAVSVALSLTAIADGEAYGISRAAIGLVGVAAGLLTFSGRTLGIDGWRALTIWTALQTPLYADEKGGNYFRQLFDIPAAASSSTTINGVITEYSQIGINLVGVVLLITVFRLRERWNISQRSRTKVQGLASA